MCSLISCSTTIFRRSPLEQTISVISLCSESYFKYGNLYLVMILHLHYVSKFPSCHYEFCLIFFFFCAEVLINMSNSLTNMHMMLIITDLVRTGHTTPPVAWLRRTKALSNFSNNCCNSLGFTRLSSWDILCSFIQKNVFSPPNPNSEWHMCKSQEEILPQNKAYDPPIAEHPIICNPKLVNMVYFLLSQLA